MKQKRFYSYALATSLLISSFGGLVNVSAATYQDAEEVKAQEHVSIMKMDASASDLFKFSTKSQSKWIPVYPQADGILEIGANVSVYDKDKKAVATILDTEDQQVFVPNVKKGEVYYLNSQGRIKIFIKNSKRIREAAKAFISNHLITVIKMLHSTFKKRKKVYGKQLQIG